MDLMLASNIFSIFFQALFGFRPCGNLLGRRLQLALCQQFLPVQHGRSFTSHRVCIVGSGPAGFYTAQTLLKNDANLVVDIFDRSPVPFGLVRYGVAPDHPEVKNVIHSFTETLQTGRCNFVGNVPVGDDGLRVRELLSKYSAVVLAYGSASERQLNIPGENLQNVFSARRFVGWYNGDPNDTDLQPILSRKPTTAVVIGVGNVALDVCRILLTPLDLLAKTDITQQSLTTLQTSSIEQVYMVGRRGPLQAAFTIKELREMTKLAGVSCISDQTYFDGIDDSFIEELPRPRRRLTALMLKMGRGQFKTAATNGGSLKTWNLTFFHRPVEMMADNTGAVCGVRFARCSLSESGDLVDTGDEMVLPCSVVVKSIGYQGRSIDSDLPFDERRGTIRNEGGGRVVGWDRLFCAGWIKRGPVGVIAGTLADAIETGRIVCGDLLKDGFQSPPTVLDSRLDAVYEYLKGRGFEPISFSGWKSIDDRETELGLALGKPREKITSFTALLDTAKKSGQ